MIDRIINAIKGKRKLELTMSRSENTFSGSIKNVYNKKAITYNLYFPSSVKNVDDLRKFLLETKLSIASPEGEKKYSEGELEPKTIQLKRAFYNLAFLFPEEISEKSLTTTDVFSKKHLFVTELEL